MQKWQILWPLASDGENAKKSFYAFLKKEGYIALYKSVGLLNLLQLINQ